MLPAFRSDLFLLFLIQLCFIPHSIFSEYVDENRDFSQEDNWAQWLEYVRKTSDSTDDDHPMSLQEQRSTSNDDSCRQIIVAKDGSGDYSTIQEAVDSVPINNMVCTLISIQAGVYREKVTISKRQPFITFLGQKRQTMIVWNDTSDTPGPRGLPLSTFHSATVAVNSMHFTAINMIFMNDAPPPQPGKVGGQAVALRITGDMAAFYNCRIYGQQDTLYDHKGRHYFKNCYIQGSIDFIFGNGRSLYKNCQLHAASLGPGFVGSVTAQKRNEPSLDTGFSFVNCSLTGTANVYLGRAWGMDSRVVFALTWLDEIVVPAGWNNWGIPARERTVYYGQYKCWGPGADTSTRVPWARELTADEAEPFLSIGFINGMAWLKGI